jgi:hypothetical protein
MKYFFIIILFIFGVTNASAENISVQIGDQVYQCTGTGTGTSSCTGQTEAFKSELQLCNSQYNLEWCINNTWPSFKDRNPGCYSQGRAECLTICNAQYNLEWCMQNGCK